MCLINLSRLQEKDGQTAKPSTTRVRPVIEFPASLHGPDSVRFLTEVMNHLKLKADLKRLVIQNTRTATTLRRIPAMASESISL